MHKETQDAALIAAKNEAQAQMLANRLAKRFRHLAKWAKRTGVSAFRLYDRDIPEIPLVLDYYGGAVRGGAVVAGALYQRPYEKDEADEKEWLRVMREAVAESLGIDKGNIFLKCRERQRGPSQYEKMGEQGRTGEAREGGLVFKVNFSDYLDTGLFLDRRLMRACVSKEAAGKRLLNLFCYTASFSVYAAAGGAARTDSIDLSNTYLQWAKENFSLNGFQAELLGEEDFFQNRKAPDKNGHYLVRSDVLSFLDRAAARGLRWDLIVLDPPGFSNSKKMTTVFDLKRDHISLLSRCLSLLSEGGKLWFSANERQFKTGAAELEADLSVDFSGLAVRDLGNKIVDEDFRGRKTPPGFVISAPNGCAPLPPAYSPGLSHNGNRRGLPGGRAAGRRGPEGR